MVEARRASSTMGGGGGKTARPHTSLLGDGEACAMHVATTTCLEKVSNGRFRVECEHSPYFSSLGALCAQLSTLFFDEARRPPAHAAQTPSSHPDDVRVPCLLLPARSVELSAQRGQAGSCATSTRDASAVRAGGREAY